MYTDTARPNHLAQEVIDCHARLAQQLQPFATAVLPGGHNAVGTVPGKAGLETGGQAPAATPARPSMPGGAFDHTTLLRDLGKAAAYGADQTAKRGR